MSVIEVPNHRTRTVRFRWVSVVGSLVAAALFLGSAALQLVASLQRWVIFRGSLTEPISAEDHLYDYSFPRAPWEPIGTAAQLFGIGLLLLALGVAVMPLSVLAMARAYKRRGMAVVGVIVEILLAVLVAGSFAIRGAHAILSGVAGAPSSLHNTGALEWFGILGLIALGVLWQRKSLAVTAACIFLIGGTDLGRLLAAFVIAPMFAAGVSHDTTPWTETVVAASAAAAGVAMLFTAAAALPRAPRGQGHVDDVRLASGGAT